MTQIANNVSPAQFWGRKFMNSTSRKYVVLVGYNENPENIAHSTVFFTDENGRMLTTQGMKWYLFWTSYVQSMLEGVDFAESK